MKIVFFLMVVLPVWVMGQKAEVLIFNEKTHDFGTIDENEGSADFEFTFVNNSGRTITILGVSASCGCTTPGWSKDPIPNGKSGFVKASFNPKGRPGYFNKNLTVTTNLDNAPIMLYIRGNVTNEMINNDVTRLTSKNGNLRLKANEINFGKIYINRAPTTQEVALYNAGAKAIVIDSIKSPDYLKVEAPDTIAADGRALLKLTYNAVLRNQFGFVADKVLLITSDEESPRKTFPVFATIEEYFLPVAPEEMDKVPVLSMEVNSLDFGTVSMGSVVEREIKLRNTGKKELIIRYLQSNCQCLGVKTNKQRLKPGEEAKVTLSLKAEGKRGAQHKAVTIYSTDPNNPVQLISIVLDAK